MKTRIVVSMLLLPLLFIVVLALPKIFTAILFGVLAAIAAYELLISTGYMKHIRLASYAMVMAFLVSLWSHFGAPYAIGVLGLLVFTGILFAEMMLSHVKLRFEKVALCYVAGILVPYLFTSLVRIHSVSGTGRYFIMLPFIVAFMSDTGGYFIGRYFGKYKLAPVISPKKTIEGAVGGIIGAVVGILVYSLVLQFAFNFQVNFFYSIIYGLVGSFVGIFGDLCFSVLKRQTGIKDYGNLIPGHGGILDRFDSMMMVAPLMEVLLILIPLAVK